METAAHVHQILDRLHEAVWELTALALVLGGDPRSGPELRACAEEVVSALDLVPPAPDAPASAPELAEALAQDTYNVAFDAAAPVLQCAALLSGSTAWTTQDDAALLAQARASARAAAPFKEFVVPMLDGLAERLDGESPRMLDVGVGVAAMAVEYCRVFPRLHVVGLDVFPRALQLARTIVDDAGMAARIELREQDVSHLDDEGLFALAWLPAPFVPRRAIEDGVPRIAAALAPGGWLVLGHLKLRGNGLSDAVTRFRTTANGGTPLDADDARELLRGAGLDAVRTLPTPDDAPALTVGRRPPDGA